MRRTCVSGVEKIVKKDKQTFLSQRFASKINHHGTSTYTVGFDQCRGLIIPVLLCECARHGHVAHLYYRSDRRGDDYTFDVGAVHKIMSVESRRLRSDIPKFLCTFEDTNRSVHSWLNGRWKFKEIVIRYPRWCTPCQWLGHTFRRGNFVIEGWCHVDNPVNAFDRIVERILLENNR